jgi:hypothetical protein
VTRVHRPVYYTRCYFSGTFTRFLLFMKKDWENNAEVAKGSVNLKNDGCRPRTSLS